MNPSIICADLSWSRRARLEGTEAYGTAVDALVEFLASLDGPVAIHLDGVGIERLAAESPTTLSHLRQVDRRLERLGCGYTRSLAHLHGAESFVRQLQLGAVVLERHFETRPSAWSIGSRFPQLPQLLRGIGVSLGFVMGSSGSRRRVASTAPDGTRASSVMPSSTAGTVECRVIAPSDGSSALGPLRGRATVSIAEIAETGEDDFESLDAEVALGLRADRHARWSRRCESAVLYAEGLAVLRDLLQNAPFPRWEIDEAWRELLSGQSVECQREDDDVPGAIAQLSFARSLGLSGGIVHRTIRELAREVERDGIVTNPFGWPIETSGFDEDTGQTLVLGPIPPFGYISARDAVPVRVLPEIEFFEDADEITIARGDLQVIVDTERGMIRQILTRSHPRGALDTRHPLLDFQVSIDGRSSRLERAEIEVHEDDGYVSIRRFGTKTGFIIVTIGLAPTEDAVDLSIDLTGLKRPDPGANGALRLAIEPLELGTALLADGPFAITTVHEKGSGDEPIPFTAFSLVDFAGGDRGLIVLHDGSQQCHRTATGIEVTLLSTTSEDGDNGVDPSLPPRFRLLPHSGLRNHERHRRAREFEDPSDAALPFVEEGLPDRTATTPHFPAGQRPAEPSLPEIFGPIHLSGDPSIVLSALTEGPTSGSRV
ncbi:MAG: hypothetical protein KDC38_08325, partial [Planctomycetes bacterium]|nr:hypothetical protein [Planctomycetota bacterium]